MNNRFKIIRYIIENEIPFTRSAYAHHRGMIDGCLDATFLQVRDIIKTADSIYEALNDPTPFPDVAFTHYWVGKITAMRRIVELEDLLMADLYGDSAHRSLISFIQELVPINYFDYF